MSEQLDMFPPAPVTLKMSFTDLLGHPKWMTERERRARWARWLRLARAKPKSRDAASYWQDKSACLDCRHRRGAAWCSSMELPCTVNPYLTMKHGMIGMACAGAGYERKPGLPPEPEDESRIPF